MKRDVTLKKSILSLLLIVMGISSNAQWTVVTQPSLAGVNDLVVANSKLFIASSYGIFSSPTDVVWDTLINGMTVTGVFTFNTTIFNFNNVMYSGATNGVLYKSVDFGVNWTRMPIASGLGSTHKALYVNGNTILTGWSASPGLRVSTDGGTTWATTQVPGVNSIVEYNGNLYIHTLSGIYKSTDNGATVTQLAGGLPAGGGGGSIVESNGVLIATIYLSGVYVSSDDGVTWTETSPLTGPLGGTGVQLLADNGTVYLSWGGSSNGEKMFKSSDDGSNWTDITGTGINSFVVLKTMAVFNGYLYTGSTVLYKLNISNAASISTFEDAVKVNVYPNPTTGNEITIETHGSFSVVIYSSTGQTVKTVSNLSNTDKINVEGFAKGLYSIQITGEDFITVKKLLIH